MYLRTIFHFSEPICGCDQLNLDWIVQHSSDNKSSLFLRCQTCQSILHIPHEKFLAGFYFDKPYPKGVKPREGKEEKIVPKEVIHLDDENKIIQFPSNQQTPSMLKKE